MMPPLVIDYQDRRQGLRLGWLILGIAVLLSLDAAYTRWTLEREVGALEVHLQGKTRTVSSSSPQDEKSAKPLDVERGEAEEVMRQLATPWETLFRSIERAYIDEVALLGVQPDAQRRSVTITGEAKEYGDILTYVTRLRGEAPFADVYLVGNEVKESDPHRPLLFTVAAQWKAGQ